MLHNPSKSNVLGQPTGSFVERCAALRVAASKPPKAAEAVTPAKALPKPADAAIKFLKAFDPKGRHNLVAIDPEKVARLEGRTFEPEAWAEIAAWIEAREGRRNLYFSVNEPAASAPDSKLSKGDVAAIRAVHVDIDPLGDDLEADMASRRAQTEAERARLRQFAEGLDKGLVPPSVTIDSGNGIQALWLFTQKLDAADNIAPVEAQNRGVAQALDGDMPAHDIARILRLPGTLNIPDASKRAKGRTERRASVITDRDGKYTLPQIAARYKPIAEVERTDNSPAIQLLMNSIDLHVVTQAGTYGELPADLRRKFEAACANGSGIKGLWESGRSTGGDETSSGARLDLAKFLKARDFTLDEFGALLWVWDHATSHGKPRIEDWDDWYIRREITRCWANAPIMVPDPSKWLEALSDDLIEAAGDAALFDPKPEKRRLPFVSFADAAASAMTQSTKPLVKGLLDQGALSVLYGESNVGKTFVAMDVAFHVAVGLDWAGCRTERMGVAYIAAEGGQGARRRAGALACRYGEKAASDARFQLLPASVDLRRPDADLSQLVEAVNDFADIGLIVIDTLSRALAGGDENSSTDMGALVKHVDRLRLETGAHVMLVHHSGKDRARGARGHSLLRAATDTEIEIADNTISVTKQRDLDGNFRRAFVLDRVELGKDEDGDPITSCVVRLVSHVELPAGEPTDVEKEILGALEELHEDNMSAAGFKPEDVADVCSEGGRRLPVETVRTRLRSLKEKRLVDQPKRGRWSLKRDNLSSKTGGNRSTDWLQQLDAP